MCGTQHQEVEAGGSGGIQGHLQLHSKLKASLPLLLYYNAKMQLENYAKIEIGFLEKRKAIKVKT